MTFLNIVEQITLKERILNCIIPLAVLLIMYFIASIIIDAIKMKISKKHIVPEQAVEEESEDLLE